MRSSSRPDAAVVVASFNRASSLERLLASLALEAAAEGTPPFEVVVVDDGSTDETPSMLQRLAATLPLSLQVVRLGRNGGIAAARNRGWTSTMAEAVLFTDDDCVVRPGWIRGLAEALDEADIAQGRTVPAPAQVANRGPFAHTMDVPRQDAHYPTCNIAYRRSTLVEMGGFDETFRLYGEDTDLAWRAIDSGARTTFVDVAIVEHDVRPSAFGAHLRDLRRRGGLVHLVRNHPRIREWLPYRGYLRPTHPPAIALACVTIVALARRLDASMLVAMAAAGSWYALISHRYRWGPPKRWQWAVVFPLGLIADLFEIAVLGRASLQYRCVVL